MYEAGFAQADVTPEGGQDLCGFAMRQGRTTGINDRLMSRALFLRDGSSRVILSSTDILGVSREMADRMRRDIAEHASIPASAVNLASTHTHSGPATAPLKYCGKQDPAYMRDLQHAICTAAIASTRKRKNVTIEVASTTAEGNRNRRIPDGPLDQELIVARLRDADSGNGIAVLCNYACHPVVLGERNMQVSADYPGYLSRYVSAQSGAECLFFNGACGDTNPVIDHRVEPKEAQKLGELLGKRALDALKRATAVEGTLSTWSTQMELPLRQPKSASELEKDRKLAVESFRLKPDWFSEQVGTLTRKMRAGMYPKVMIAPLTLVSFGLDLGMLFVPGELFSEIGLNLKLASPFKHLMVCTYANGVVGYLPTRITFEKGGYEPYVSCLFYGKPAFSPDVEDAVVSAAARLFARAAA